MAILKTYGELPKLLTAHSGSVDTKPRDNIAEDTAVLEPKAKVKRPPMFKVVLVNDDYTPMDFVVYILCEIFRKNQEEAVQIMMDVHNSGFGICGVYTRDVAETKADQVILIARSHEYPLQCRVEEA